MIQAEKTTNVAIALKLAQARESVEVVGQTPLIDKTNTSDTTTVRAELTDKLPVVRGYQNVIDFAPGQNDIDGDGNPNARGAPDSGNVFLFDGVDTTDPTTGTFGANNNFDTIQEVVVSNANISAEYGRVQGGVFNVITKSGTNWFHGSGRALLTNDSWNADNKGINPISGEPFNRTKFDENIYDYLFTLGGPVWKDHIWFFGAYERNPQTTPEQQTQTSFLHPEGGTGESYQRHRLYEAWQGKLTGQITPSHALNFSAQADPFTGDVRDYWGAAADLESLTAQDQANNCPWACIWQARYSGIFGSNVAVEATYAQQRGGISVTNFEGDGPPYINLSDGLTYNGGAFVGTVDRPRNQVNGAVSYFATIGGHSHNFKVGVDYQEIESVNDYAFPGNQLFFVTDYDPIAHQPILSPGDQRLDFLPQSPSISSGKSWGIYALDRFELGPRLSFNLGLRADIQSANSDAQRLSIDTTSIAPRLSMAYDFSGHGTTLLSAGWGRYYEFIAQSLVDAIFANNPQEAQYDVYTWNGDAFEFSYPVRVVDQPVNPNLKASHVDEYNLALQQQIGQTMAVAIRGIYRKWNNIIDDIKILDDDGNKILTPINFDSDIINRQYKAVELSFERRFSKNFQALVTYTLSLGEGQRGPVLLADGVHDAAPGLPEPDLHRARGRRHARDLGALPGDPGPQPRRLPALGRDQLGQALHGLHVSVLVHDPDGRAVVHVLLGPDVPAAAFARHQRRPGPLLRHAAGILAAEGLVPGQLLARGLVPGFPAGRVRDQGRHLQRHQPAARDRRDPHRADAHRALRPAHDPHRPERPAGVSDLRGGAVLENENVGRAAVKAAPTSVGRDARCGSS